MFAKKSLTFILVTLLVAASCTNGEKPNARLGRQTTDVEVLERKLKGRKSYKDYGGYECNKSCADKYPKFLYYLAYKMPYLPLEFPSSCCYWSALYLKHAGPKLREMFGGDGIMMLEDTDGGEPEMAAVEQLLDGAEEETIAKDLDAFAIAMEQTPNDVDADEEAQKYFPPMIKCIRGYRGRGGSYKQMQCIFKSIYPYMKYRTLDACYCHYRNDLHCSLEADCGYSYKLDFIHSGYYPYKMCGQCTYGDYYGFPNVEGWNKCTGYCHMAAAYYYKYRNPAP